MHAIADAAWHIPLGPRNAIDAYLLGDVLVDTGVRQSAATITRALSGRAIALTHAYRDHAAGAIEPSTVGFGHGPVPRDDAARLLHDFVQRPPLS